MQRLGLGALLPATRVERQGAMDRVGVGIGMALASHLQARVYGRGLVVGPRVVAYGYHFDGLSTDLMRRAQSADLLAVLEHQLGVEWMACHRARGLLWYSVPNPAPFTLSATAFDGSGLEAAIGVDRMGQPVDVDLLRTPHVLLAMPTGGGKTTAAQALAYRLAAQNAPRQVRFVVIASDLPRWRPLEALPHLWAIVHHNDAAPVLEWALGETERRESLGVTDPRVILVLDDAHALVTRGGIAVETMTTLSQQARRAGIHLVITAHGTDKRNLGSADVERNVERRIIAATSATNAAQMTGRGGTGAHRLLGRGEAVSVDGPSETPVTLAVVTADDFAELGARWGMGDVEPAPWASSVVGRRNAPPVSAVSPVSASDTLVLRVLRPESAPAEALTPLIALTEREREITRLLRESKSPHDIAVTLTGNKGGPTYQAAVREVKDFINRWLPPLEAEA